MTRSIAAEHNERVHLQNLGNYFNNFGAFRLPFSWGASCCCLSYLLSYNLQSGMQWATCYSSGLSLELHPAAWQMPPGAHLSLPNIDLTSLTKPPPLELEEEFEDELLAPGAGAGAAGGPV